MQRGHIYKHHGSWLLRYWDTVLDGDEPVRKPRTVKLARGDETYPTKRSVLLLAEKYLAPINSGLIQPASSARVKDFIEHQYLPYVKRELRPSTHKGYNDIFEVHLKARLGNLMLRDFRTVTGQRLLKDIHSNNGIRHLTMSHIKSMLSGVFTFALREGVLDGVNPMRSVQIPGRPERRKQPVYSLKEVVDIIVALAKPELAKNPARIVATVAAFSGLRISEIRGLRWEDYDGETLHVRRAIWRTHVSRPKTLESEADVPVLKMVKTVLDVHRRASPNAQPHDYIFKGERGFALNMANLAARVIKPALAEKGLVWKGWHSFRRGLATNLYAVDASPKIIQSILRQSDVSSVAMKHYVQTTDAASRAALARLEEATKFPWMGT